MSDLNKGLITTDDKRKRKSLINLISEQVAEGDGLNAANGGDKTVQMKRFC